MICAPISIEQARIGFPPKSSYEDHLLVVSFDVGYTNMAISVAYVKPDWSSFSVVYIEKVNIAHVEHNRINEASCKLRHTRHTVDLVEHFIQERELMINDCDAIVLERQPPGGLKDVEALLYSRFREKCLLCSPNAMHKYFGISHLSYSERKLETEAIARYHLSDTPYLLDIFDALDRKHDIADAVCLLAFEISTLHKYSFLKEELGVEIPKRHRKTARLALNYLESVESKDEFSQSSRMYDLEHDHIKTRLYAPRKTITRPILCGTRRMSPYFNESRESTTEKKCTGLKRFYRHKVRGIS